MESISISETPPKKPAEPLKPKKGVIALLIILVLIFVLTAGGLGYLYWQKNNNYKKLNQDKQTQIDNLNQDKTNLEKQVADLTKENTDLKNTSQQSSETAANKLTIIKAYTEILTYFAQVVELHSGFTGWTNAEYLHARDIAKKTQSSSFLATVDWAWNQESVDPILRVVRFLKEIAAGINENL